MRTLIFIALLLAGLQPAAQHTGPLAQSTPADVPPTLDYSQQVALDQLEHQRVQIEQQLQQLKGQWTGVAEVERSIAAEFAHQHPGWHLDDKFLPIKDAPTPALHVPGGLISQPQKTGD